MAEDVRVTNMPESGTREYVAYKLWADLSYALPSEGDWKEQVNRSLDLYNTCLNATRHLRKAMIE